MKAFYSKQTLAAHFAAITTYEIDGRQVVLMLGQVQSFVISAVEACATYYESAPNGEPVHQILAEMRIETHDVGNGERQYSAESYWQAEDFDADAMEPLMRATLATRCDIKLITGEELAKVKAAESARRQAEFNEILARHRDTFDRLADM